MKVSREEKKNEAICRMARLGLIPAAIKQFKNENLINISEPPFGGLFWVKEDDLERIKAFEEKWDAVVYHVIRSFTDMGQMDSFLYVSDNKDEWGLDNEGIGSGEVLAYVFNHDEPDCSEIGYIGVKRTIAAGLARIY